MSEEELRSEIEATGWTSVCFEPVYPPEHDRVATSFFGGRPLLPDHIEWPVYDICVDWEMRQNAEGKEYRFEKMASIAPTFIGQIDLTDLPPSDAKSMLPESGMLYFFFDTFTGATSHDGKPGTGGRVIFWPGDAAGFAPRDELPELHACYGKNAHYYHKWLNCCHTEKFPYPRCFDKWAVRPLALKTYKVDLPWHVFDDRTAEERKALDRLQRSMNEEEVISAFPKIVERSEFKYEKEDIGKWHSGFGGPGYPFTWICVEIFFGLFLLDVEEFQETLISSAVRERMPKAPKPKMPMSLSEWCEWAVPQFHKLMNTKTIASLSDLDAYSQQQLADVLAMKKDAEDWITRAREKGRFNALQNADRTAFHEWCNNAINTAGDLDRDPRGMVRYCLSESYKLGPGKCLSHSAEAAAHVPESWIEEQRWQYAIHVNGYNKETTQHALLGNCYGRSSDDHIPLMQFPSMTGLGWRWHDVDVLEFSITRSDLEARNFDNVVVSVLF